MRKRIARVGLLCLRVLDVSTGGLATEECLPGEVDGDQEFGPWIGVSVGASGLVAEIC